VANRAHINGMESSWNTMKRGYMGTYHRMSPAHVQRYVNEFQAGITNGPATPRSRCA